MMESTLFSIGHGTKDLSEFTTELQSFGVQFVIDVRSNPTSKWAHQYDMKEFSLYLQSIGIKYGYMGDLIGGRPLQSDCIDNDGYYNYEKMANIPAFKYGLQRLVNANLNRFVVAVMCSESDPSQCHRSKLIGRELYDKFNIDMRHIVAPNRFVLESEIIASLTNWVPEGDLFGMIPLPYFKSRKSYKEKVLENEPYYD